MEYHLDIAETEPDRWVAHIFELHGCFSRGETAEKAVKAAPEAIADYLIWRDGYGSEQPVTPDNIEVSELIGCINRGKYYINAFFEHDRLALTKDDIDQISIILSYTHNDLNNLLQTIPHDLFNREIPDERFVSINGIISHIATAEWWYFDSMKLGYARDELNGDPRVDLEMTRKKTLSVMSQLVSSTDIVLRREENWSARKILRRTLWHEIVHTRHIRRRLNELFSTS